MSGGSSGGRIVVTGAAGFLGSYLAAEARARGMDVVPAGRAAVAALLADPTPLNGTDVLVHAAAIRHRHGTTAADYHASNVDLVERLVRVAAGRVGRFVHVSSVGVYGFPRELPIRETSPFAPRTLYSQTKIEGEKVVRRLARELAVPFTIVRPTILYGKGDKNGMLDKLAAMLRAGRYRLVGSGQNVLHHTYVVDAAGGILDLAAEGRAKNDDFIVAGPETITLRRLGELVAAQIGVRVPRLGVPLALARAVATGIDFAAYRGLFFAPPSGEPPINHEKLDVMTLPIAFDITKARAAGYRPRVGYEEGIRLTLGGGAGS
jgi:nucleoside-diphosphate-sugar epimerase